MPSASVDPPRSQCRRTSPSGAEERGREGWLMPVSSHEPAYPLGPRFAGPRQGLARDSAPSIPQGGPCSGAACVFAQRRTGSDRCRSRAARRLRSRSMPVPDAVHVRVRATDCRRNLVGGMLRRALTRAVNMTGGCPQGAHRRRVRGTPCPPAASAAARNAGGSGKQHYAAITDPKEAGPLLRLLDGYRGTLPVRCALRLAPLLFVRPGGLRKRPSGPTSTLRGPSGATR